jgi:hypothetical protein
MFSGLPLLRRPKMYQLFISLAIVQLGVTTLLELPELSLLQL